MKQVVLTDNERINNIKESKKKYYEKNKERFKEWNNNTGFMRLINNTNDKIKLNELIKIIQNKLLIIE
tara:strand:- start:3137 stop:3340 length:204 start_codon:yes stop_codon:yes gene_type:complete